MKKLILSAATLLTTATVVTTTSCGLTDDQTLQITIDELAKYSKTTLTHYDFTHSEISRKVFDNQTAVQLGLEFEDVSPIRGLDIYVSKEKQSNNLFFSITGEKTVEVEITEFGKGEQSGFNSFMEILDYSIDEEIRAYTGSDDMASLQNKIKELLPEKVEVNSTPVELMSDVESWQSSYEIINFPFEYSETDEDALSKNSDWLKQDLAKDEVDREWDHENNTFASGVIEGTNVKGNNIIIKFKGTDDFAHKTISIGARMDYRSGFNSSVYDQVSASNYSSIGSIVNFAHSMFETPQPYSIELALWDASSTGRHGSEAYAEYLKKDVNDIDDDTSQPELSGITNGFHHAMYVDLDNIVGGDRIYLGYGVEQTKSEITTVDAETTFKKYYEEFKKNSSNYDVVTDTATYLPFTEDWDGEFPIPEYDFDTYVEGQIHFDSDHLSFANLDISTSFSEAEGIPVMSIVSTNYEINGINGKTGESQTSSRDFWYPDPEFLFDNIWDGDINNIPADGTYYTKEQLEIGIKGGIFGDELINVNGYDVKFEMGWGKIWDTIHDSFGDYELTSQHEHEIKKQLTFVQDKIIVLLSRLNDFHS